MTCEFCEGIERLANNIRWLESQLVGETDIGAIRDLERNISDLEDDIDNLLNWCECEDGDTAVTGEG
jgi:hypothetical protein